MLEDSTRFDGETPLTESGKARLVRYGWLLPMASKRVGCSPFLPTMERDIYIERDSQKTTDKREIMRERTFFREMELEREGENVRERESQRVRENGRECQR